MVSEKSAALARVPVKRQRTPLIEKNREERGERMKGLGGHLCCRHL
jgi:hypothetical protein